MKPSKASALPAETSSVAAKASAVACVVKASTVKTSTVEATTVKTAAMAAVKTAAVASACKDIFRYEDERGRNGQQENNSQPRSSVHFRSSRIVAMRLTRASRCALG
jgi:hypothetical protein